ncbi:SNF1-related protein kinase regulatory subunit gamma-1 isoform X2 [Dendrobium catenatum]|uniref:SNF1-related protein kinase regulatory subunit gamma-1 isoform X2 n=1 Tax=Dendrobium catenatum TaxID=906689 RepID=UPI0010A01FBD|nr:SNF1-related protein kinase regulatory subunit gamma-1 isoform X2 [Dendrobium catenatum]
MDSPRTPRELSSPEAKIGLRVEDLWDVQEPMLSPSEKLNSCFESIPVSSFPSAAPSLDVAACHGDDFGANSSTKGSFFEYLTSSHFYRSTKVQDISGSFRWAPFLALQKEDSFLTMLLLLSKYRMKSLPVVDLGEGKIENIITQSAVVHMLAECVDLHWFKNWGTKKLFELGLPIMKPDKLVKAFEEEPVLSAFQLLRKRRIGGLPIVDESGHKVVGNISIRDVQYLLTAPEIYKNLRSITAKNFLAAVRNYLLGRQEASPLLHSVITCRRTDMLEDIILKLDSEKIHRIYVVNEEGNLEGVITLRDIISKLVHEPHGYFGNFFDGVVPLPANSRV